MDLNALLGSGMLDPVDLGKRVFQELQDRLASKGTFLDISAKPPEELLATALGDWLVRMIGNDDSSAMADGPMASDRKAEQVYEELSDRNVVLAVTLSPAASRASSERRRQDSRLIRAAAEARAAGPIGAWAQ
jgi:hypothetical protein